MSRSGVFLDRDGVLNAARIVDGRPLPPRTLGELEILDGARAACAELSDAGFTLIGVTNQPDIARGTTDRATVDALNHAVTEALALDDLVVCPHDDADDCACRKPRPGMILAAAARWDIDLEHSVTVGDRWRDVEAGKAAGTKTVYIDRNYAERRPESPDLTVAGLEESTAWIIRTATAPQL